MIVVAQIYEHEHQKAMSCGAVAQLVATMFYHRRFFPFYTDSIIVGLDKEGESSCYRRPVLQQVLALQVKGAYSVLILWVHMRESNTEQEALLPPCCSRS